MLFALIVLGGGISALYQLVEVAVGLYEALGCTADIDSYVFSLAVVESTRSYAVGAFNKYLSAEQPLDIVEHFRGDGI